MDSGEFNALAFFYYAIEAMHHLTEIPISDLEELEIGTLQRISRAANFDGVMLVLSVDSNDRNLVVGNYCPDRQSKPLLPFLESPDSTIYISNDADPSEVVQKLQEICVHYSALTAPPFQKYTHNDENADMSWIVPMEEFLIANARAKYKHELFMRDHGMHNIVIPPV